MKRLIIRQFTVFCLFLCICAASLNYDIYAENGASVSVADQEIRRSIGETSLTGFVPVIKTENADLNRLLAAKIDDIVKNETKSASDSISKIVFSYRTVFDSDIASAVVYVEKTENRPQPRAAFPSKSVYSINFSQSSGKIITLADVCGQNVIKLLTRVIKSEIKANPSKYNNAFTVLSDGHDFLLENGVLTLLFDDFEIAPGSQELITLDFYLDSITVKRFEASEYITASEFNFKMIPLHAIAEAFDYSLSWEAATQSIRVAKGGSPVCSFAVGKNQYVIGAAGVPGSSQKALEYAPILSGDRTYVPLSFVETILDLTYTIENKTIVISGYAPRNENALPR